MHAVKAGPRIYVLNPLSLISLLQSSAVIGSAALIVGRHARGGAGALAFGPPSAPGPHPRRGASARSVAAAFLSLGRRTVMEAEAPLPGGHVTRGCLRLLTVAGEAPRRDHIAPSLSRKESWILTERSRPHFLFFLFSF